MLLAEKGVVSKGLAISAQTYGQRKDNKFKWEVRPATTRECPPDAQWRLSEGVATAGAVPVGTPLQ